MKEQLEDVINTWYAYICNNHIETENKLFDKKYINKQKEINTIALAKEIRQYILQDKDLIKSSAWLSITDNIFDEEHNIKGIHYLNNLCPESNIVDTMQNILNVLAHTNHVKPISLKNQLQSSSISSVISAIKALYNFKNLKFMKFVIANI